MVASVRHVAVVTPVTPTTTSTSAATGTTATTAAVPTVSSPGPSGKALAVPKERTVSMRAIYAPTVHSQLTLVTSNSAAPWNTDQATVVVARMRGEPYVAVPQESRSPSEQGNSGDPDALAWLLLDLLALVAIVLASAALYRRTSLRSAYLLTTPPLLVFTILAAEAISHLLPAWL